MTEPDLPTGRPLKDLPDERLTELARGIVTDKWLIVDINDPRWQQSLALLLQLMKTGFAPNVGAVLVPVAPHMGGYWTDNIPGVTLTVQFVPDHQVPTLQERVRRMNQALFPERDAPATAPTD